MNAPVVETSMSAGQLAAMILARWRLIVISTLAFALLSLALTLVLPKTYIASSDVYVDYQSNDPLTPRQFSPMLDENYMEDQIALIRSYEVSSRVVEMLHLADNPEFKARTDGMNEAQRLRAYRDLINGVNRRIDAISRGTSRVLEVRFTAPSPEGARDGANAVVQAYFDLTSQIARRTGQERLDLYDSQLEKMRLQADAAQRKLNDFEREKGVVLTSAREDVAVNDLSTALASLVEVQVERQRAQARWENIETQLKQGTAPADIPEIASRGDIADIRGKLTDIQRNLAAARGPGVLGSNNPQLRSLEAERSSLQANLTRSAKSVLDAMRLMPQELVTQEKSLQQEVDQRRKLILQGRETRTVMDGMQRQLDSATRTYESASQKYGDLLISTNVANSNVVVLRAAQAPATHNSPSRRINTLLGLIVGGMLGLGAALFLELSNRRVRHEDDIERSLGMPVLGKVGGKRKKGQA